jgi:hypothetical protein
MPITRCTLAFLLLVAPLVAPAAQTPTSGPRLDIGFGLGQGLGGSKRTDRTLLSGSVLLSKKLRELTSGALMIVGSGSVNILWRRSDCGRSLDGCRSYPSDASLGVLVGWTRREDQWNSLRILAGPALMTSTDDWRGVGATTRVDYARQLNPVLSVVVWTQAQLQPRGGDFRAPMSAGLGVRTTRVRARAPDEPRVTPPPPPGPPPRRPPP